VQGENLELRAIAAAAELADIDQGEELELRAIVNRKCRRSDRVDSTPLRAVRRREVRCRVHGFAVEPAFVCSVGRSVPAGP
jgi:hypothetical protein